MDNLAAWAEETFGRSFDGIDSFIGGITRDPDAVKNAIRLEYNNGLAESSVNKFKVIKRVVYGRNSFKLPRDKLLRMEDVRSLNLLRKEPTLL